MPSAGESHAGHSELPDLVYRMCVTFRSLEIRRDMARRSPVRRSRVSDAGRVVRSKVMRRSSTPLEATTSRAGAVACRDDAQGGASLGARHASTFPSYDARSSAVAPQVIRARGRRSQHSLALEPGLIQG